MRKNKMIFYIMDGIKKLKQVIGDEITINYIDKRNNKAPIKYAKPGDACMDLYAASVEKLKGGKLLSYKTGIYVEVPPGYEMELKPRSSIFKTDLLLCNSPATIDSGFRGEITVNFVVVNSQDNPVVYEVGDRICQFKINKLKKFKLKETTVLSQTERGESGFGSSGK